MCFFIPLVELTISVTIRDGECAFPIFDEYSETCDIIGTCDWEEMVPLILWLVGIVGMVSWME